MKDRNKVSEPSTQDSDSNHFKAFLDFAGDEQVETSVSCINAEGPVTFATPSKDGFQVARLTEDPKAILAGLMADIEALTAIPPNIFGAPQAALAAHFKPSPSPSTSACEVTATAATTSSYTLPEILENERSLRKAVESIDSKLLEEFLKESFLEPSSPSSIIHPGRSKSAACAHSTNSPFFPPPPRAPSAKRKRGSTPFASDKQVEPSIASINTGGLATSDPVDDSKAILATPEKDIEGVAANTLLVTQTAPLSHFESAVAPSNSSFFTPPRPSAEKGCAGVEQIGAFLPSINAEEPEKRQVTEVATGCYLS